MIAAIGGASMAEVKPAGSATLNIYIFVEIAVTTKRWQTQRPEAAGSWFPSFDLHDFRQLLEVAGRDSAGEAGIDGSGVTPSYAGDGA
jgi:hypothetical protein